MKAAQILVKLCVVVVLPAFFLPALDGVWGPSPLVAQAISPDRNGSAVLSGTETPDAAADLFLRSVRAIRWDATARLLDDEVLERFRTTVRMIVDADRSGEMGTFLVQSDSAGLDALASTDVFARSIGALIEDMPGLMHALYDRDDVVIGHIAEGSDAAHVVYRTTARISGAVPEVKVMQLRRTQTGWRVAWSDELEVLEAALRGVGR